MCRRSNRQDVSVAAIARVAVTEVVTAAAPATDAPGGDLAVVVATNAAATAVAAVATEMILSLLRYILIQTFS